MSITTTPYGFIPTQVSGLVLWLDASDATTITQSSGNITQWRDKSTSALTATGVSNPQYVTNVQNGFPGISFDGSTQYFNLGNNLSMGTNQLYIFVVSKFNSTADGAIIGKSLYGGATGRYSLLRVGGTLNPLIQGSGGGNDTGVNSDTSTSTRLLNMVWDRSNINLYQNGSSIFSLSFSDSANVTNGFSLLIGAYQNSSGGTPPVAGLYMNGYIHEILMYFTSTGSPLGNTARQQIESYLAQKWGLTLGAGHPGLTSTVYRSTYLKNSAVKRNIATMTPFYTAFSPKSLPGLGIWLDGADPAGTGTVPTSGATITSWKDKSGSANHFGTTSGTTTNILDVGKYGINFPLGAVMTSANQITFTTSSQFFIVCKLLDGAGFAMTIAFPNAVGISGTGDFSMRFNGGVLLGTPVGGDGNDLGNGTYYVNGNFNPNYTSTTYYNVYCMIDTAARTSGTSYVTLSSLLYSRSFTGYIMEFLYFPAGISSTQRQQIESYLAQKWGLTSSLPSGHLHLTQPAGARTALSLANSKFSLTPILSYILKYTYTGSNQSFVVPSGVTSVNVYMWGAGGGGGLGGGGGAGCYVQGVLTVIPGETLTIVVGQGGGNKQRSFGKTYGGGGQGGGPDNGRSDTPASQGGGRSAIVRSSTDLVTAAAGGGGRGGRGGRGRLVTGENGTGAATGGTQSAGGTNNGAIYSGGNANQDNSAGGGAGYYGGGGGGQDQAGGGGSSLTSNLSLLAGESTFGTESSNGVLAPQTSSPYYNSDVAFGATTSYGYNYGSGGNGLVVISFTSKTTVATLTYSRIILLAWYGSVAYRYGLNVTTIVNNAFANNPSNTITLSLATFTDPQVGTTKFTFIAYMFNGIQKFSSAYAEGTVLTFSSLT